MIDMDYGISRVSMSMMEDGMECQELLKINSSTFTVQTGFMKILMEKEIMLNSTAHNLEALPKMLFQFICYLD
jgi:hypothetical protein